MQEFITQIQKYGMNQVNAKAEIRQNFNYLDKRFFIMPLFTASSLPSVPQVLSETHQTDRVGGKL